MAEIIIEKKKKTLRNRCMFENIHFFCLINANLFMNLSFPLPSHAPNFCFILHPYWTFSFANTRKPTSSSLSKPFPYSPCGLPLPSSSSPTHFAVVRYLCCPSVRVTLGSSRQWRLLLWFFIFTEYFSLVKTALGAQTPLEIYILLCISCLANFPGPRGCVAAVTYGIWKSNRTRTNSNKSHIQKPQLGRANCSVWKAVWNLLHRRHHCRN